ncbi:MAG TPA: tetratricopeptide repeat protein [Candidatus Binataceae bacterium]|jgi:tetratricopeptide (TPR) repeat protein|nr:tetratricopeptide repeat protein [Candidatus Binataceae bacterium]
MKRISQHRRLVILREDHIGEPLGAVFLDQSPERAETNLSLLRTYLGPRVQILQVELFADRIQVQVEIQAFADEATRLAAVADDLVNKGAPRNALELFRRALELDPLNCHAARGAGALFMRQGRYQEALEMLRRARETGPENADVLYAMGQAALKLERLATATAYLERAFELAPDHFAARRALTELGRRPKPVSRPRANGARTTTLSLERGQR